MTNYINSELIGNMLTLVGLLQAVLVLMKRKENMVAQIFFGVLLMIFSFQVKLYADIFESVVTTIIAFLGLKTWFIDKTELHNTTDKEFKSSLLLFLISSILIYFLLLMTDDIHPLMDSITTGLGLSAGYLMARKSLQSWTIWMLYDILTFILYFNIEAVGPTVLSFIWIPMAIMTYVSWDKEINPKEMLLNEK